MLENLQHPHPNMIQFSSMDQSLRKLQFLFTILLTVQGACFFIGVSSVPWRECQPIKIKNGAHVLDCSGADLIQMPDYLDDDAEVLDFSQNRFVELPIILESKLCDDSYVCPPVNATDNHCRSTISFSRNEIYRFHDHALHNLRCLKSLDLSFNEIRNTTLHQYSFQEGAHELEELILRGNPLHTLPDNVITQPFMKCLKHLDLAHCQLEKIGENSVDDFSELEYLDLSHNKLEKIKKLTFKGLRNLRVLDLRHNRLGYLNHQVFADLIHLEYLLLSHNQIGGFASDAFYSDSRLKTLDLSFNKLRFIPYQAIKDLSHLSNLILSNNPIAQVGGSKLPNLLSVKTLEMTNMSRLRVLENAALNAFPSLNTLFIRYSKNLKEIKPHFLSANTSILKEVYLEFNGLSTLSPDSLPWKTLDLLQLDGNPWVCDHRLRWTIKARSIPLHTVTCNSPIQYKGRDIKTIDPAHLAQEYPIMPVIVVIVLALTIPAVVLGIYMGFRLRHYLSCCGGEVQGRYITLFTHDLEEDGKDQVDFKMTVFRKDLQAVSNGNADDTQPFLTLEHHQSQSINCGDEEKVQCVNERE